MDTPMFIEANTDYAIQMNRGGSSQPYHTSLIRSSYPYATDNDQENVRFCSAFSRDPVACVNQVTSHLNTPARHRWPTSPQSAWTSSVREHFHYPVRESYQREPLRDYTGMFNLRHLQKKRGDLPA